MNLNTGKDLDIGSNHHENIYLGCPSRNYIPFHPRYTEKCIKIKKNDQIQAIDSEEECDQYSTKRQATFHRGQLQNICIQYPNMPDDNILNRKLQMRNNYTCKYVGSASLGGTPPKSHCRECPNIMKRDSSDGPTPTVTREDENLITALAEKLLAPIIHSSGFNGDLQQRPYDPLRNEAYYAQRLETDSSSDDIHDQAERTSNIITLPKLSGQIANVTSVLVAEKMNTCVQTAVAQKKNARITAKSLCPCCSIGTQCNIELMSADIIKENAMHKYAKKVSDTKPKRQNSNLDEWLNNDTPPGTPTKTVDRSQLNEELMRLLTPYKSKHKMLLARTQFLEGEVKRINATVKLLMDENKQLASRVVNAEELTSKIRNIYTKALMKEQQSQISNPSGQIPPQRPINQVEGGSPRELLQETVPSWSAPSQRNAAIRSALNQESVPSRATSSQESAVTRSALDQETAAFRGVVNQGNVPTWNTSYQPIAATRAVTRNAWNHETGQPKSSEDYKANKE